MKRLFSLLLLLFTCTLATWSQQFPSASPVMTYLNEEGFLAEENAFDGSAPLEAHFTANLCDVGDYTPLCEWRFCQQGASEPFLRRYEADTDYTFTTAGSFTVELRVSFVLNGDTIEYSQDEAFVITIRPSRLEFPNAFTPNGDGINDIFRAKDGFESIVSFRAQIFNRHGKKLYEWNSPAGGWDGDGAPDGPYYLHVVAKGADGIEYNIKKTITLLRKFLEGQGTQ